MEDKKEYQRTLQHLQAQLEKAHEQRKNLDIDSIKKRLKDCQKMLYYYTLMRTKNKMKDSEEKSEELWQVIEEYFTKELKKNLVQYRLGERIMRCKLEVYQNNFLDFVCGSLTSIEVSGQDEKTKVGPNGTTQEEEIQIEK